MLIVIVYFLIAFSSFYILSMVEDSYFLEKYVDKIVKQEEVISLSNAVIDLIENYLSTDDPKIDSLKDNWAKPLTIPLTNGSVEITIIDQERYLNPNMLVSKKGINGIYLEIFRKLYGMLNIDEYLVYNLIDWIDKNSISDGGVERYENYKAKNGKLDSIEEILLIEGYKPEILYGNKEKFSDMPPLKDFLTVYSNGKININTAPKYVLLALGFDYTNISNIIEERNREPFSSINDFFRRINLQEQDKKRFKDILDVKSEYFLVIANINFEDESYKLRFLLKRKNKKFNLIWKILN